MYAFALIVPDFFGFFPFVGDCIVRTKLLNVWIVRKTFHQSIWVFVVLCFKLEKHPSSWEFVLSFPNLWHRVLFCNTVVLMNFLLNRNVDEPHGLADPEHLVAEASKCGEKNR